MGAATGADGRIYAAGGWGTSVMTTTEAYTPAGNAWTQVAALPTARDSLGLAPGSDGLIYAVGGENAGGTPLSEVVAAENRNLPPNLPATAVAGLATMKEREKGVADFLHQHGGHE